MAPSTFLILETLDRLDTLTPRPQDHAAATPAPRLKKVDGAIDWTKRARDIVNLARGCNPWPGATATAPGGTLTIWRARALAGAARDAPGTLAAHDGALGAATGAGLLLPVEVQPPHRRAMSLADYLLAASLD